MNYRRGLQRVYVVLTVAWIAGVFTISVIDRPKRDWFAENAPPQAIPPATPLPTPPAGFILDPPAKASQEVPTFEEFKNEARVRYWVNHAGVAVLPPVLIYLLLFIVAPWVYRGFNPGTQI